MENVVQENEKASSGAIKIDEKEIRTHLDGLVRQSVEDTLNALLNAEADAICQASRYQRSPDRQVRSSLVGRLLRLRQLTFVICKSLRNKCAQNIGHYRISRRIRIISSFPDGFSP